MSLRIGIGTNLRIQGSSDWASYWATQTEAYELWKITGAGDLVGLKRGDILTVGGTAGSYTFQVPNTAPYQTYDTDYLWFWGIQKTVTEAQLIGYDFGRTVVRYSDNSPYGIEYIMILSDAVTGDVRNKMFADFKLHFLWDDNANFTYGHLKGNRTGYNPLPITDADGNVYTTVTIGSQLIVLQNLKTTKYNDGTAIPTGLSDANWALEDGTAGHDGAYALVNNSAANTAAYGLLYNWPAVNNAKGIAPLGCRVMTQADLTTLIATLGGLAGMGNKIKEAGTTYWNAVNGGTNSSGFGARGAGYRAGNGVFGGLKAAGIWHLSDSHSASNAKRYYALNNDANVGNDNESKLYGNSVRCIKI